ncbi:hypothetical protein VTH06DRAFT_6153 [Thermothelomyces fergusii]
MNSAAPEMYYSQHISAGPAPPPQTVTSPYTHQHPQQHSQPPLLQPGPSQYGPPPPPQYGGQYAYANGLSPPPGPPVSNALTAPQPVLPLPGVSQPGVPNSAYGSSTFDTTGQIAPPGVKPRVTATLWEDEGSLCFQVEARGICVARREDNSMINGTKLLNVAGMTRGRRDGILKSEKVRHVVKIGPMHLKGVWIPFERALDFANKEKITELLYPLFVHNISNLLCHPTNQSRGQVMAAAQRKQIPGLPSIPPQLALPGPPQPQMPSHPPSMWNQQGMGNGQGPSQVSIDTSLTNNSRSLPSTPATTPPGSSLQSMHSYPPVSQPYDNSRPMYQSGPPSSSYPPPSNDRPPIYANTHNNYVKSEMGPPAARPSGAGAEQGDTKPPNGMMQAGQGEATASAEEEADHENDGEYTHDSGAYDANRSAYPYNAPPVSSLSNDHSHISPELAGSPHQGGSGRATPRTAAAPQPYYGPQGYSTPPRVGQTSSNLYNVVSNERGSANGASTNDVYGNQGDMSGSMPNGYPVLSGVPTLKRGRDEDDDRGDLKRQKGLVNGAGSMPSPTFNNQMTQPTAAISAQRRR